MTELENQIQLFKDIREAVERGDMEIAMMLINGAIKVLERQNEQPKTGNIRAFRGRLKI